MTRKQKPQEQSRPTREQKKIAAIAAVKDQAAKQALDFFHDPYRQAYATVPVSGHRETWRIKSRYFLLWVKQVLYDQTCEAPDKLVKEIVEEFETHAICRGAKHNVHVRIAEQDGVTYIDLVNAKWQVLAISAGGWSVLDESPVKFQRFAGATSLPLPQHGASTLREIAQFLNVNPRSEVLLLAWLTYALRTNTPYPVLALSGVQGSGKSTITRVLRELIDPSMAAMTTIPKSERDMAIAATNSHLIAMDNLSEISPALSDAMCRIATGGAFRCRTLYTNNEETIFTYRRPLIINGIEELPVRPDLLDRSIIIHVEPIAEQNRRDERSFWSDFEDVRPQLFGAMLDVIQEGIRNVDGVDLPNPPRMADFARWGVATERAAGYAAGAFMQAYAANREDAHAAALDSSPIAHGIEAFIREKKRFFGTALRLLNELRGWLDSPHNHSELRLLLNHPKFPKSANQLSAELARIEPNLKNLGMVVERRRTRKSRDIRIELADSEDDRVPASQPAAAAYA